jgi:hypothetical protein
VTGTAGPFDRALGPEHVEGLPGKVISFHIVPLHPAYRRAGKAGLAGHVPVIRQLKIDSVTGTGPFCFKPEVEGNKKGSGDRRKIKTPSIS